MKPFSIRVPEEVYNKLKEMDTNFVRERLTEIAGFTYDKGENIRYIEEIVKEFLKDNINNIDYIEEEVNTEEHEIDEDLTQKALDSVMNIMNGFGS
ncbi:MAG: hypothetical protein FH751_14420 [Firmicutes bacterium]|nr:hypothetical protein [Bacillota bacterium]